ncbi:MAG TPA: TnsD family Tn7-like transposition protein [Pyrinomonadaceae bacterium]|nr:TnsD family Tn7-like transposition protein [Pyrinomonadaceae bacterium]
MWLLDNGHSPYDLTALFDRYVRLLSARGLAVMSGRVWINKLLPAIKDDFTSDILKLFQSDFDESNPTSWPARLLHVMRSGSAQHPLRHLLMMRFLRRSAESLFKKESPPQPFGAGPWPCLNRTCPQYKRLYIIKAEVVYRKVCSKGVRPVATFECGGCGFAYYRAGPDLSPKDLFRIGRVLRFGPVWEKALRKYWEDATLALTEVAKRLGFSGAITIRREAERLGLAFPRRGPRNTMAEINRKQEPPRKKKPSKEEIKDHRQKWRFILKNNPGLSPKALGKKFGYHHYSWLRRYDSEWLATHTPRSSKGFRPKSRVNWRVLDAELARAIRVAAKLLKEAHGKPVKVTTASIARNIDFGSKLLNQLHRLPRSRETLKKVVESRLEFAERRLRWVVERCREGNIPFSMREVRRRTVINSADWNILLLKAETDEALRALLAGY